MSLIINAVATEKAVAALERENKVTFIVKAHASKQEIKNEIEKEYGEKVVKVTTLVTPDGRKKAMVRLEREGAAPDLAAKLKVI